MASTLPPHDAGITRLVLSFLVFFSFFFASTVSAGTLNVLELKLIQEPNQNRRPPTLRSRSMNASSLPMHAMSSCGAEVPSEFSCPGSDTCMVLASNTTILCCPDGASCDKIKPVVCNVKLQDVSKHPEAPILTTALDSELPRCGDACCPFGYLCNKSDQCVLDEDQDGYDYLIPVTTTMTATSTLVVTKVSSTPPTTTTEAGLPDGVSTLPTAPEVVIPTDTSDTSDEPIESEEPKKASEKGAGPTGLVAAAAVAGVCCFAGIGIFIWMKYFRKRRPQRGSMTMDPNSGWDSWKILESPQGTPVLPRHLVLKRGPDEKFVAAPREKGQLGHREPQEPRESPEPQEFWTPKVATVPEEPEEPQTTAKQPEGKESRLLTKKLKTASLVVRSPHPQPLSHHPPHFRPKSSRSLRHPRPQVSPQTLAPSPMSSSSPSSSSSSSSRSQSPRQIQPHSSPKSPFGDGAEIDSDDEDVVELPATPVSFCMWEDLENAELEEPKLAYIIPAKRKSEK